MKKYFIFFLLFFINICTCNKQAYCQITEQKSNLHLDIKASSYPDYEPFSYPEYTSDFIYIDTIFNNAVSKILETNNIKTYVVSYDTYNDNIQGAKNGKFDLLFGIYNETHTEYKQFENIEYFYPAGIQNPIHLIMLPDNISKIKSTTDLKKLKGIYIQKEYFSDYLHKIFTENNIQPVDTPLIAYEKLFLGEVDYIIGSYYYNYVQALKLGLKDYISFSKKPLWTMPMFIAISLKSKNYSRLKSLISKNITKQSFAKDIEESLKNIVKKYEEKNIGIVPPLFVLQQNDALTPADEKQ